MLREGLSQLSFLESKKSALRGLIPHWRLSAMGALPVGDTLDILSLEIRTMPVPRTSSACHGRKDAGGVGGEAPSGAVSRPYFSWSAELMDVN
jgi:hypothetical protein